MKEAQTGREESDDGGGFMAPGREGRRRSGLVVILEKARQAVLIIQTGVKVPAYGPRMPIAQPVVQPLVIGVVEALLLHRPFQIPVDLGHEQEFRMLLPNRGDCPWPERLGPVAP